MRPEENETLRAAVARALEELRGVADPDAARAAIPTDPAALAEALLETVGALAERMRVESAGRESAELAGQSQRMESIGRLAGGVAHEFNNLLTVILGFGELLASDLDGADPGRAYVDEIMKAGGRAQALTQQLLAFGRRQVLAPTVLDLNAVVSDLHGMLRALVGEDIELTTVLALGVGPVRADLSQIQQVIVNLAANARHAMPNGGRLTIETDAVTVDESQPPPFPSLQPGSYVRLTVTDTGEGMDAETQLHLFEPFFTTKELGRGTGLGLATVYGIVKQSGGHIWIASAPGEGTRVNLYLPFADDPLQVSQIAPSTEAPAGTETILVVEDEDQVRSLVAGVLRKAGYAVLEAGLPEEALRLAETYESPIDLLLTDLVMPGMSGRAVAERMEDLRPGTRTLYMSGYTDDAAIRLGIVEAAFLPKPFSSAALTQKVRAVLDA